MRELLFVNLVFFFPNEQHLNFFTLLVFPNFYLSQNISGALKHRNLSLLPFYEIMSLPTYLCHYLPTYLCQALFDKSLMTLEFLYRAMLSFKGMRFY